jgi:hypothetical protein
VEMRAIRFCSAFSAQGCSPGRPRASTPRKRAAAHGLDVAYWHEPANEGGGRACPLCPSTSDINLFCYRERIIDLDAEIADRTLDLRVAKQKLHGPKVSRSPVDQSRFRPSQ